MKSQIPNNENGNVIIVLLKIEDFSKANHSFNNPEQILPKPIQSEIRFHQLDNGKGNTKKKKKIFVIKIKIKIATVFLDSFFQK